MQLQSATALAPDTSMALNSLLLEAKGAFQRDPCWAERCIGHALEILGHSRTPSTTDIPGGLLPWRMSRVRDAIETRLEEPLSTTDLAAAAGLSPSRFARAFKTSHGISPHQYLIRARIERAKALMLTSTNALSDIALACGLADQSHFSRLFRRLEGETPAAWRRRRQASRTQR